MIAATTRVAARRSCQPPTRFFSWWPSVSMVDMVAEPPRVSGRPDTATRRNPLLYELVVLATDGQLAAVGGSAGSYDRDLRSDLVIQVIADNQAAGVESDDLRSRA